MTPVFKLITVSSFIGILAIVVVHFIKTRRRKILIVQLAAIAVFFGFVYYHFYRVAPPVARSGDSNDIYFVIVLYIFMLLGMVSHFFYSRFEEPKRDRLPFDFGLFIAPIFASPIIFIPLVSALQNANIDLAHLTTPKLMVFLVAFENGFFWKEYFDNRRQKVGGEK